MTRRYSRRETELTSDLDNHQADSAIFTNLQRLGVSMIKDTAFYNLLLTVMCLSVYIIAGFLQREAKHILDYGVEWWITPLLRLLGGTPTSLHFDTVVYRNQFQKPPLLELLLAKPESYRASLGLFGLLQAIPLNKYHFFTHTQKKPTPVTFLLCLLCFNRFLFKRIGFFPLNYFAQMFIIIIGCLHTALPFRLDLMAWKTTVNRK